jgi:hypothetical protein
MKRLIGPIALVLVIGLGSYALFAQQQDPSQGQSQPGMMGRGMGGGGMMGQRGMMGSNGGMMPMGSMRGMMTQAMAGSISHEAMVATSDGGVVVWTGGKLKKYDSNLNLVKEVELKVDYEAMQQRMQKMMESMPMRGGTMPMGQNRMRRSGGDSGGGSPQP